MTTGRELLEQLNVDHNRESNEVLWIEVTDRIELCKLTEQGLRDAGYAGNLEEARQALTKGDLGPFNDLSGLPLKCRFVVWCDQDGDSVSVWTETTQNTEVLLQFLQPHLPANVISRVGPKSRRFQSGITISLSGSVDPVWRRLQSHPGIHILSGTRRA